MSAFLRPWMLAVGIVLLIAVHMIVLYRVSSHMALGMATVAGAIILVLIKHLGLLGSYTLFRRRSRRNER
jgi:hypothetical protein